MSLKTVSENKCFGGQQGVYAHASSETGTEMRFSLFLPGDAAGPVPLLTWLSGLTCTEENFTVKAGAQRYAAEQGVAVLAPDTSPRGTDLPGEHDAYDFGSGAGFYVDATEAPWSDHYCMYGHVTRELPTLVGEHFPVDLARQGLFGHSMGGHGALTIALKNPETYRSVSAFAPIVSPMNCPWGEKALTGYLGADRAPWRRYDACALIEDGARLEHILVDQGEADDFLAEQLKPELLEAVCDGAGVPLTLNRRPGYDHSYFFIASFIGEHIAYHAERLKG